ncbi:MAG: tetratricopeptide repeat protein [Candidatus Hydrogenedentes bacterium]|nr:tetratricopeptide repeat protein [Candidatus Hydrogenedentota bacterium]
MTVKTHVFIWTIAAAALISAGGVALLRGARAAKENTPAEDPVALVQKALDALALDSLALNMETQGALRAAAVAVEQGLVHGPEAYYVLALQYQRELNTPAAEEVYRRSIEQAPDWSWPYAGLGTLLSRNAFGREQEAIDTLRKAIALEPGWARPHNTLAVLLRVLGYLEEAEQEALKALELDPSDVSVQNNYANLMISEGRFDEAEEHYLTATELNPDHPKPFYNLACLYSLTGKREKALEYLEAAILRASILRAEAAEDPDLESIREMPRFKELVYGSADVLPAPSPQEAE